MKPQLTIQSQRRGVTDLERLTVKRILIVALALVFASAATVIGLCIYVRPIIRGDMTATFARDLSATRFPRMKVYDFARNW
jgi:hypothetical protein